MKPIVVIADDLTGAAEMAGIGLRFGLATRLVVDRETFDSPGAPLTVINADTRWLPEADAVRVVGGLVKGIDAGALLFKKVDSAIRGHILAEIEAALGATDRYDHVLLLPQNPTRNRIVLPDGSYLVEGIPLARTTFANDPDHPARTSNVMDRVARSRRPALLRLDPREPLQAGSINVAAAETFEAVRQWSAQATPGTLLVGAADLFTATLERQGLEVAPHPTAIQMTGPRLYLCGSTSTSSRRLLRSFATSNGVEVTSTVDRARDSIRRTGLAVVMSPEPGGIEQDPRDVEDALGAVGRALVGAGEVSWLFAEGGATAAAVCRALGWTALEVEAELATGVVALRPEASVRLVIKPGSYNWPESVLAIDRGSR